MKIKLLGKLFLILTTCLMLLILGANLLVLGQDSALALQPIEEVLSATGVQAWMDVGWTGREQHVAVLDVGFGRINDYLATASIDFQILPDASIDDYDADSAQNGTLALETMAIIAPDASYYLCRYLTYEEYVACVDWFIASNVQIINHASGVPALAIEGENIWEAQGQRAAELGILWVNAVGNYNGGINTDEFFDSDGDGNHEFLAGEEADPSALIVTPAVGGQQTVALSWSGARGIGATEIDLDLMVETAEGAVYRSEVRQTGQADDLPLEFVTFVTDMPYTVRIIGVTVPGSPDIFLYTPFANSAPNTVESSVISPASFRNVMAVGAMENGEIASYSSLGPGRDNITKPDLAAPAAFILPGGAEFRGSGASSALISGTAALIWQSYPSFSLQEVFEFISQVSTQDDSAVLGADNTYGEGYFFIREPENTPEPESANASNGTPSDSTGPVADPPIAVAPGYEGPVAVVDEPDSIIREGPGVTYPSAGQVNQGDAFPITGQADQNNWIEIEHPDPNIGRAWIGASNVTVENANSTPIPPAEAIPTALPTPLPLLAYYGGTGTYSGFGAFWTLGNINVRAQPSGNASISGSIACGEIVQLVGIQTGDAGIWYQTANGDWVSGSVIIVYPTRAEADANYNSLYNTRCVPPTSTPLPTAIPTTPPQVNNPPPNNSGGSGSGSGSGGTTQYTITIRNNTGDCDDFSGSIGPRNFSNLDHGGSTSVQLPAGSYTFSGSGTTCFVGATTVNVSGNMELSF